ncbi:RluA family pseudouridine synthase [Sulfuriflexus sp.]|uniref:RluA family pseudouridine synthase n=1 Tax=Sulfuriflexus sp. TaxID=2015443 RepID=UPI0028CF56F3|nr:RluA family pseudouridine synthase [Sulfuriflexus sp.]MDT8403104.1 RluA family pseudouridine synthase [Sulfuriflexus sp.]
MTVFEKHLTVADNNESVIAQLAASSDLSRQRIKQAMFKGAVWFTRGNSTQRIRRATKTLQPGDVVHLYYDEKVLAREPLPAEIVADQGAYSIWYKPYGMLSQGSKWGDHCTIRRWAEQHLLPQRPALVVHRLDRAATGLILIAHEKKVATALAALFESRAIEKCYRAIVHGRFPDETQTINSDIDGKTAISHVRRLDYDETLWKSLVEVKIETGRKHQIRRHLSEAGFPIVGDRLYGDVKKNSEHEDLQLTAFTLAFQCPVTDKPLTFRLADDRLPQLSSPATA